MKSIFDVVPAKDPDCEKTELHPRWMTDNAEALGQRPLSQVVMAGAHDALMGGYGKGVFEAQWMVQTQDLNLWGLLQYGVRAFDMRFCTPEDQPDTFYVCHGGFYDEKGSPTTVTEDLKAFTNANPQEILVIGWRFEKHLGNVETRKKICSEFFKDFRHIMVPTTAANGTNTLDEIWNLPGDPRIIFHSESGACDPYYNDPAYSPVNVSDRDNLDWRNRFYGGQWANTPDGDLDPNATGQCGLKVDVQAIVDQVPATHKDLINLIMTELYSDPYCTDVATANTLDLTSNLSPTKLNTTQALLTGSDYPEILQGAYALTVGVPDVPSQWPAISSNLANLWINNTLGARPRFNILMGDFVEHTALWGVAFLLNTGPLIEPNLIHTDSGEPYTPGQGNWSNGLTLKISCEEEVFGILLESFPVDKVTVSGAGINQTLSGPGPWEVQPVENGAVTLECIDTSGKIARTTISGININAAPVVDAGPDTTIDEGDALNLAATFTDESAGDTHVATIDWGDGATESGIVTEPNGGNSGAVAGSHVYPDNGSFTVTVCVTDSFDSEDCDSLELTVNNVAPSVDTPTVFASPSDEGKTVRAFASFTDPGILDTHTCAVDYGDGDGLEAGTSDGDTCMGPEHTYLDGDSVYTVTVEVTDNAGDIGSNSTEQTVNNVAPSVDTPVVEPSSSVEGQSVVASASFSYPGILDTHTCSVDYGDGSDPQAGTVTDFTCTGPAHTYLDDDPSGTASDDYNVTITVCDNGEDCGQADTAQTVSNLLSAIESLDVGPALVAVDTAVDLSADFTDPGILDTHTATIDWGDGVVEGGAVTDGAGSGTVGSSHAYTTAGIYTVTLTLTDDDGGEDTATFEFVVVYDPAGGFVTGGGWIDSPAGAYRADPTLTGKANFGFVAKYQKGANQPTGNTQFQFKAGDLNFHSESYQWLVVNQGGTNAQFKGTGTINGELAPTGDPYTFMIWAGDGSPDTFRIRIWYEDGGSEVEVYDNGVGQPIDAGSIVIHTYSGTPSWLSEVSIATTVIR